MHMHFRYLIFYVAGNEVSWPKFCPTSPRRGWFLYPARSVLPETSCNSTCLSSHGTRCYYVMHLEAVSHSSVLPLEVTSQLISVPAATYLNISTVQKQDFCPWLLTLPTFVWHCHLFPWLWLWYCFPQTKSQAESSSLGPWWVLDPILNGTLNGSSWGPSKHLRHQHLRWNSSICTPLKGYTPFPITYTLSVA